MHKTALDRNTYKKLNLKFRNIVFILWETNGMQANDDVMMLFNESFSF